ncbi:predicted protein [Streptomyces iranensis]|uniref:Uncharacterized protein n=1 Tax=Streptomyces iranensis TaxID=576784 RepID=A0A060ZW61_9ACTN|nr:predicted protein [Streptomyces iranensis]
MRKHIVLLRPRLDKIKTRTR